jgi:hypothetical protein
MIGIKTDQNAGKTPQPTNNGQISEQTPGIVLIMFSSYPMMVLSAIVAMFLLMNLAWLVEGLFMDKKNYCGNRF